MKVVVAPKVQVQQPDAEQQPGTNCLGCNALICVPD